MIRILPSIIFAFCLGSMVLHSQTVEFSDDFESGITNWTLQGSWALTTTQSNSPSNSLTDSPAGNYLANQNISATMATGVDLTSALDATLNFSAIYDIEGGNFDYCYVEASPDGGTSWINIATFLGEGNLSPWVDYTYSLGGLVGNSDVRIRFRLFTDGGYEVDGIYIDDVEIVSSDTDNGAPLVLHTPPEFYESAPGAVTMSAEIVDISGISSADLFYSLDGGTNFDSVSGTQGTGDNWSFEIPEQPAGTEVHYYVHVLDASAAQNETITDTYVYIAGNHLYYDNGVVDFVNTFGPDAASGQTGCAVRFTLDLQNIKYALIRNYTDQNRPNNDITFHIWADATGVPGADLITPFTVTPEATLINNSPMTRIDLSAYADELKDITGDVFMGYTVETGQCWLVQTTPAVATRSYDFDGVSWVPQSDDYHFRLVTEPGTPSSTHDAYFGQSVMLQPNPAESKTTIDYNFGEALDLQVTITNGLGQLVWLNEYQKAKQGKIELDLTHYKNGLYFVNLSDGVHQITRRLIVGK